jgi:hypothetical protein
VSKGKKARTSNFRFAIVRRASAPLAAVRGTFSRPHCAGAPDFARNGFCAAVFAGLLILLALVAAPAGAVKTHFLLGDFGSAAQPTFGFEGPNSLAIDQSNGDLLVMDPESQTITRWKPDGTPDNFSALGTNVIDGFGPGDETPVPGLQFPFNAIVEQIAVDNSGTATNGNIYVTEGIEREAVYVFSSAGVYLGGLTGYKEGAEATGPVSAYGFACGVTTGPDGSVYIGDRLNGVHKYVPSGSVPSNSDNVANFNSVPRVCNLAAGVGPTAGSIFVVSPVASSQLTKLDALTGELKYVLDDHVAAVAVDPSTGRVYGGMEADNGGVHGNGGFTDFDASGATGPTLIVYVPHPPGGEGAAQGIAVRESTGHIFLSEFRYQKVRVFSVLLTQADVEILPAREVSATRARMRGTVDPNSVAVTSCEFEYGLVSSGTFAGSVPCGEAIPVDGEVHTVSGVVSGLPADGAEYQYRLVVTNTDGRTATSGVHTFDLPLPIRTGPPVRISNHAATATGIVRPEGGQITECKFEYGHTAAYGSSVPCSPAAGAIPADFGTYTVTGALQGLDEFTVYHYRLVFTTAGAPWTGEDELFRTSGPTGLPDNRRYEQVSPPDKNGGDVSTGHSMAAVDGNRLIYNSTGSFAGAPTSQAVIGLQYETARGPNGWSTESIMPPGGELEANGYQTFSRDLSKGVLIWPEQNLQRSPLDPRAQRGFNLYLHTTGSSAFNLLNGTRDDVGQFSLGAAISGSSDFSHIAIVSHNPLTPDAPTGPNECTGKQGVGELTTCAYEWDSGTLRLASIVDGVPVTGGPGTAHGNRMCGYEHAMSDDGSRLFFASPGVPNSGAQLYARENGTSTRLISESERTLPGGLSGEDVDFQNAEAAHGNLVVFTTRNALVNADTDETNDLYLYDYTKPAGERLSLISEDQNPNAPEGAMIDGGPDPFDPCGGVAGASEDLRRVYFVADNQIVAGAPEEAGPKLYLWDDTGASPTVTYIKTLNPGSEEAHGWQGPLREQTLEGSIIGFARTARVSPSGRFFAILSTAKLTDFENEGNKEVYAYDAVTGSFACASCNEDANPASGEVAFEESSGTLGERAMVGHVGTNVTDSGQVFFQTNMGLIPNDPNGKTDVYEYENGQLYLISSGEGDEPSFFLDSTPSGSDAFFTTKDHLVGWDKDENADVYDARVNGGFPEPPPQGPPCEGDACQPAPSLPLEATPGSSVLEGAGNVTERKHRCGRHKGRRHGRCVKKKHHKHRHHGKHSRHGNTTTRSHG